MLSDFDMIVHSFPERQGITIIPVSDVHLGAAEHMEKEWNAFCKKVLETPNVYLTLGGDLMNNSTRSSVANPFDEVLRPREQKRLMCEMLMPLRERILCIVSGNHERRSIKESDDDPTYDIACKLDLENLYRENVAFMKIQIGDVKGNGLQNPTYCIAVTHGAGGGALTGSAVNKGERFGYVIDGVDCLIVGHTHKPFVTQPSKIYVDKYNNKITMKPFKVVCATSWLEYGGYAARNMMMPSSHCIQTLGLAGNHKEILVTM